MVKVTVIAGDSKFTSFLHEEADYWAIENGVLCIMKKDGNDLVNYAPGAWLKVEYAELPSDSS